MMYRNVINIKNVIGQSSLSGISFLKHFAINLPDAFTTGAVNLQRDKP